jgi:hypothetical protein
MSDLKINITIICNQTDCTFNKNQHLSHKGLDVCIHPHPNIQKWGIYPQWTECTCNSKAIKDWINPVSPSCQVCETPTQDNCILCCHKPKDPSHDEIFGAPFEQ